MYVHQRIQKANPFLPELHHIRSVHAAGWPGELSALQPPVHVGDAILASNRTRRVDFALFMVEALRNDRLVQEAPAIVGCKTSSALAHVANAAHA